VTYKKCFVALFRFFHIFKWIVNCFYLILSLESPTRECQKSVVLLNKGNDHQTQHVLMFLQILPTSTIRNMWRSLKRICILILGLLWSRLWSNSHYYIDRPWIWANMYSDWILTNRLSAHIICIEKWHKIGGQLKWYIFRIAIHLLQSSET